MKFTDIIQAVQPYIKMEVYEIIKRFHIDIIRDNDLLFGDMARLVWTEKETVILMKEDLNDIQEKALLLHELAHYLLHRSKFSMHMNMRQLEYEAEMFVCLYLIRLKILESQSYYHYLINHGVSSKTANKFEDTLFQYRQQFLYRDHWECMDCF